MRKVSLGEISEKPLGSYKIWLPHCTFYKTISTVNTVFYTCLQTRYKLRNLTLDYILVGKVTISASDGRKLICQRFGDRHLLIKIRHRATRPLYVTPSTRQGTRPCTADTGRYEVFPI